MPEKAIISWGPGNEAGPPTEYHFGKVPVSGGTANIEAELLNGAELFELSAVDGTERLVGIYDESLKKFVRVTQ